MSCNAMVATSQPLAAMAGVQILQQGGNAIDAAVATAAALAVVEPRSTGLGGDLFALVKLAGESSVYGLNASGRAPAALTVDLFNQIGVDKVPPDGPLSITVPGFVDGIGCLLDRFGSLDLATVLSPSIDYAEHGFPVTEEISERWRGQEAKLLKYSGADCIYLPGGKAPKPGDIFINPDLADTLRIIALNGTQAFYTGALAEKISSGVRRAGGVLSENDMQMHKSEWVDPVTIDYRNHTVYELPPNGQGVVALVSLGILRDFPIARLGHNSSAYIHLVSEALKLGFEDASHHVADPHTHEPPIGELLSEPHLTTRRDLIDPFNVITPRFEYAIFGSDTVYLSVVDRERNAVSLICSTFNGFGSGVIVEGTGVSLQNRASGFTLKEGHPNRLAPGKRPYHTIIPSMIFRDGELWASFGLMGGFMQPQGHVQVVCNLVDFEFNPQTALDAPRFRYLGGQKLALETAVEEIVAQGLTARGHSVKRGPSGLFGGGQIILVENDVLVGGSDPRKDGFAIGY